MNIKKILILLSLLILSTTVLADSISSVTTTSTATTATTGTNVAITSVSTTDSGTVTASQIQLTSTGSSTGSSLSVSDPGSPYYYSNVPVTTSGVSKSFTATAGTADTYTYQVTATWSSGSKSSTESTIQFINPTSLTVTSTPSSATISQSASFLLDVSVNNAQSSTILTSYALTADSAFSISGDPTSNSGTSIAAGSTSSLQWNITMASCFTGSKTITFGLGDNANAASVVVTSGNSSCSASSSSNSSSSSSSGGGSSSGTTSTAKTIVTSGKVVIKVPTIAAGGSKTISFTPENSPVKDILIAAKNKLTNIEITVTKLDSKPSSVSDITIGKIYQYFNIDKVNFSNTDLNSVTISIQVTKKWIADNNIDENKVVLYRYNNAWEKLVTTKTSQDSTNVYYEGASEGFSVFAITGESLTTATPSTQNNLTGSGQNQTADQKINQSLLPPLTLPDIKSDTLMIAVLVIIVIVAIAAAWYKLNKKPAKKYDYLRKTKDKY